MSERQERSYNRLNLFIQNLRWVLLIGSATLLFLNDGQPLETWLANNWVAIGVFALFCLYNALIVFLENRGVWQPWRIWATLIIDVLMCLGLFTASNNPRLLWLGFIPGLTAALRLGGVAATLIILLWASLQAGLLYITPDNFGLLASLGVATILLLFTALITSWVGTQVRNQLRLPRNTRLISPEEQQRSDILRQHARAIYEMSSMVSATLNYKEVLEAALNFGALGAEGTQPSSSSMVSVVLFFEEDQLHVASYRRLTAADQRVICAGRTGVLGAVLRTGEAEVISDPGRDPELQQFASLQACKTLMAIPLRAGYETYGVVLYAHPRSNFFDEDQQALLTAVVNQAIIALQNAQLFRNLRQEKERILEVQDEAQKKLARDLHDGPTQGVAALAMRANFVRRLLERDPKAATEELFKMEELARKTTKEIRHMLFTLRPLVLESQGLVAALQQLAEKMHETHDQNVIVEATAGVADDLELNQQGVIFYIVEEAVNNARKHAQAQHIWVRLKKQSEVLLVQIQDDGVGFDVGAVEANYDKRGSLGMVNLRERTEMLNGAIKLDSAEGRGTTINVYVPLTEGARDRLRGM